MKGDDSDRRVQLVRHLFGLAWAYGGVWLLRRPTFMLMDSDKFPLFVDKAMAGKGRRDLVRHQPSDLVSRAGPLTRRVRAYFLPSHKWRLWATGRILTSILLQPN